MFVVTYLVTKVAQVYIDFLGYFENQPFKYNLLWLVLVKFGLLFISTSGHTRIAANVVHNLLSKFFKKNIRPSKILSTFSPSLLLFFVSSHFYRSKPQHGFDL